MNETFKLSCVDGGGKKIFWRTTMLMEDGVEPLDLTKGDFICVYDNANKEIKRFVSDVRHEKLIRRFTLIKKELDENKEKIKSLQLVNNFYEDLNNRDANFLDFIGT